MLCEIYTSQNHISISFDLGQFRKYQHKLKTDSRYFGIFFYSLQTVSTSLVHSLMSEDLTYVVTIKFVPKLITVDSNCKSYKDMQIATPTFWTLWRDVGFTDMTQKPSYTVETFNIPKQSNMKLMLTVFFGKPWLPWNGHHKNPKDKRRSFDIPYWEW